MPHIDTQNPGAPLTADAEHTERVMPANWPEVCADFARTHHCQSVRVLTLPTTAAARGDLTEARQLGADLLLDDVATVAAVPLPNIDIRICNDGGQYTVQRVERPKSVAVEKTTDGRLVALRIDDADGVTTLVRRAGQRP